MNNEILEQIKIIISSIAPFDEIEKNHISNALKWIDTTDEIFRIEKPAIPSKHLGVYTVLVDPNERKVLLVGHKKSNLLIPSGGHVEKNENPFICAKREILEEISEKCELLFDSVYPFFCSQAIINTETNHIDVDLWYVFKRISSSPINDSSDEFRKEHTSYNWYTFDKILATDIKMLDPNMHRFIKKLQARLK